MGQLAKSPLRSLIACLLGATLCACERRAASPAPTAQPARPSVASLVPAATDLLIDMGAADHLVAVSNYDVPREPIRHLPRVGDYQGFDWERLSSIRPDIMIVFMAPERMPEGLKQRAAQLQIRLVNVRTERLEDVFAAMDQLGELTHEKEKAAQAAAQLRRRLEAVRQRVSGKPKVRTLVMREVSADGTVGHETFINDVLEIAGGQNVITTAGWPSIDRERLLSLKPEVVLHLLPEASEQVVQQARRTWEAMPQIPAVAGGRVHILTQWWVVQPGAQLGEMAEQFADLLHPEGRQP